MKKILLLSGLFAITVFFSSCEIGEEPGPLATEERVLSSFDGIVVDAVGKVNLHIGQEFKVIINTNSNVLDDITTSIRDNRLTIDLRGRHKEIDRLDFDVYAPEYRYIKLDGVADIRSEELLSSESLVVVQDGVGKIHLNDIDADKAWFNLDAVGDVEVSGTANEIIVDHSGVGKLRLFDLYAAKGKVDLSGTGNVEINVSDFLDIKLSGVGDVLYKGTPSMTIDHSGVGKIKQVD